MRGPILGMGLAVFFALSPALAGAKSPPAAEWAARFSGLSAGMNRAEAEKEIAKIRKVKASDEPYARQGSETVAYALDEETILLVTYKNKFAAVHSVNGHVQPPKGGALVEHKVLKLR